MILQASLYNLILYNSFKINLYGYNFYPYDHTHLFYLCNETVSDTSVLDLMVDLMLSGCSLEALIS